MSVDPYVQERQALLRLLGIEDDPNISLGDLKEMSAYGADVQRSAYPTPLEFTVDQVSKTTYSGKRPVGQDEGYVNVLHHGAIKDIDVNNLSVFQSLFVDNRTYIIPSGRYRLEGTLGVPGDKSLVLAGEGIDSTFIDCYGTSPWLDTFQAPVLGTEVAANVAAGSTVVELNSVDGIVEGQLITFTSTQTMPETTFTIGRTHVGIVTGVSGNNVTIDRPFPQDMDAVSYTISVYVYNVGRIVIRDMTITCGSSDLTYFTELRHVAGVRFENVRFYNRARTYQGKVGSGVGISAVRVQRSVDAKFIRCEFDHMHYGVMPTGATHSTTLDSCTATRSRHISAPTGGAQNTRTVNCDTYKCYAGYDSHQAAFDSQVISCSDNAPEIASKFRGRSDIIRDSVFSKGIEISNDSGVEAVASTAILRKVVDGCDVGGEISGASWNRTVRNTRANGYVNTWRSNTGGMCIIENVEMDMRGAPETSRNGLWLDYYEVFRASDVRMLGPYYGQDQSSGTVSGVIQRGVHVSNSPSPSRTNVLERIIIDGFDHGMNFSQGGNYSGYRFKDIVIRNSVKGINGLANNKVNGPVWDRISFSGCETNVVEPNRWYYPPIGSGSATDLPTARRLVWSATSPAVGGAGSWNQGDIALAISPVAAGKIGWVCTESGSPGTWKPFGVIDA